jgi:hypothetical protein
MKLRVVHDKKGSIIAISKVVDLQQSGADFFPGKGQLISDVELTDEMSLLDIYKLYCVDRAKSKRATSKLVKLKKPWKPPRRAKRGAKGFDPLQMHSPDQT